VITNISTYKTARGWVIQMDLENGTFHSMVINRGRAKMECANIRSGMEFFISVLSAHDHSPPKDQFANKWICLVCRRTDRTHETGCSQERKK
jgi:hypothetical protein